MKKILLLSCFIGLTFVLVGCSSKDFDENVVKGETALSEKRYDDAIAFFNNALESKSSQDVILLQQEAIIGKRDALIAEGDMLSKNGKFEEAIALYEQALKFDATNEALIGTIKSAKEKIDIQLSLDAYVIWLNTIVEKGEKMQAKWSSITKEIGAGTMTKETLKSEISALKDQNTSMKTEVVERSLEEEVDPKIHDSLYEILTRNDRTFSELIALSTQQEKTNADILTRGTELNELYANLVKYQKEVQGYAKDKGIKYNK